MDQHLTKPNVTGSNPVRGTRLSPGQTPFYYGVCCFIDDFIEKLFIEEVIF